MVAKKRGGKVSVWEPYKEEIEYYLGIGVNVNSIHKIIVNKIKEKNKPKKEPVLDGLYKWISRKGIKAK